MNRGILVLALLLASGFAVNFTRVGYMPIGEDYQGNICFSRSFDDSSVEMYVNTDRPHSPYITRYRYRPWNLLAPRDSISRVRQWAWSAWAVGDFDKDSLTDMAVEIEESLAVFESGSRDSFPKQAVWKWPYEFGGAGCHETHIQDLDQDGWSELIFSQGWVLYILENYGNNQYRLVFKDSFSNSGSGRSDFAFGDFDLDGRRELAIPYGGLPSVTVYECTGDNQYRRTWVDSTPYVNSFDAVATDDADGDGKPEFWIGWMKYVGGWLFGIRAYEAVGDDSYQRIFLDTTWAWTAGGAFVSAAGDLDSDGTEEVVWCISNNWFVYEAVGNDRFERVFGAYPEPRGNRHWDTKVYVHDLNGNGYPEIIETGQIENDSLTETKVFEIEGVRLHGPNGGEVLQPGSQFPITWEKFNPPGADSFSLFASFDNAQTFQTIKTGLTATDTMFLWSIPDTVADSCKIMIWAYGPPRAGENTPRGTAWDFSDSTFSIRQTEVAEGTGYRAQGTVLRILQNPTTKAKGIRLLVTNPSPQAKLQVFDVAGKLVRSLAISSMPNAPCLIALRLSAGVYFVRLEAEGGVMTRKVVVVE